MTENKKFDARVSFISDQYYHLESETEGNFEIPKRVMHRNSCDFGELINPATGELRVGSVIHLFSNDVNIYPDHEAYKKHKDANESKDRILTEAEKYYIDSLPRIPVYTKTLISVLLNRMSELGQECVEQFLDGLVTNCEETVNAIHRHFGLPLLPPESQTIEYKSSLCHCAGAALDPAKKQRLELAQSICGMANSDGGRIYIGVSDDKELHGLNSEIKNLTKLNEVDGSLRNTFTQLLGAFANHIDLKWYNANGQVVLIITVPKADHPVSVKGTFFFKRLGSNTTLLKGESIYDLFKSKIA